MRCSSLRLGFVGIKFDKKKGDFFSPQHETSSIDFLHIQLTYIKAYTNDENWGNQPFLSLQKSQK